MLQTSEPGRDPVRSPAGGIAAIQGIVLSGGNGVGYKSWAVRSVHAGAIRILADMNVGRGSTSMPEGSGLRRQRVAS